jgi:peptidyl-prolyl cis-trans isomerase SurA
MGSDHRRYTEKKDIREKMYAEKYEAKSKSYLQEVRGAAMIEYR